MPTTLTTTTTAVWMHGYIWNGFLVARAFVDSFQLFAMNIKIALRFNITCAVINEWMNVCVCLWVRVKSRYFFLKMSIEHVTIVCLWKLLTVARCLCIGFKKIFRPFYLRKCADASSEKHTILRVVIVHISRNSLRTFSSECWWLWWKSTNCNVEHFCEFLKYNKQQSLE